MMSHRAMVTGAFSNIGSSVAHELLARGWQVATLTNRQPQTYNIEQTSINVHPLVFDPHHLRSVLANTDVLVNTYWVRFAHNNVNFDTAVQNSRILFEAARDADVRRIVHLSVSNASLSSPLAYYKGKAQVEQILKECGVPYSIIRPTLVVGPNDVLTSNIIWLLRKFPLFGMPTGKGYQLQPVTLDDIGRIVCDQIDTQENITVDAAGPEVFTFKEFVALLARSMGRPLRTFPIHPNLAVIALKPLGWLLRDTILTKEELEGLRINMLLSHAPPLGKSLVSQWLMTHGYSLGKTYVNDTVERFTRAKQASQKGIL